MCIVIWLLISRFLCLPSELKIRGVALTFINIFILVVAHEQKWPCKYTSNGEILCMKRMAQAEADKWRQRSLRNADVRTALTDNLQGARYGRPPRCIKGCSTIDQNKRIHEPGSHDDVAQFNGEFPNRRQSKGSQRDTDETNGGFLRPEQYSSARRKDFGYIPGEIDAMWLKEMFGLPPKSLSEPELRGLQNTINLVQTQCVRKIVKILATYVVKHLPQCNKQEAINAAVFNHKTNHAQQQRPVHKQEAASQWSKTVPLEPVHTQTQNEVRNVNKAVKNTGEATFLKTRHQLYKPTLVQGRPQKEGTEKYLVDTMGARIREQLKEEKTEMRKVIPARNENKSESILGSKVGPNAKNRKVEPVKYQTQRDSSALWKSQQNSSMAVQKKDSLPMFNAQQLPNGVKGNWKPQPPGKGETLSENNIKVSGSFVHPFKGASRIHYSRETALNRQRIRQGGQITGDNEDDQTRYIGLNSRREEHMHRQNAATKNKFMQRIVKPSGDVRANAQYKKNEVKTIMSTQMGHAALHGETHEETIASLLPLSDQSLKYRHRNLDKTKGQHVAENLWSSQRAEKGTHGHVLMELQENSLELLEEKTLPQDTVVGSRVTNQGKSGLVKTVGEVSLEGQPARPSSQRMSAEKPLSYRSKAHLRPQGTFALDNFQEEGPNHRTRSGVRANLEDSIADLKRPAKRKSPQVPIAGPRLTIEEESISLRTPNKISNHAPQNVRLRNSKPPTEKEKQNEPALIRRLTPEAQPPTRVKQAPKQSMAVQETGLPHNLATGLENGRQRHTPQNSKPISRAAKPQRTTLTGRINSVLDHQSRSQDSSEPSFNLRATSAQHPTLLHKKNFATGSINQPIKKRQPHLAQVTTQRAPILKQLNHPLISQPRPEAALHHKSASWAGASKVVQPRQIHQMGAVHRQQPTATRNLLSVEPTGSSKSYRNVVTSKPLVKIKPPRLVHTQRPTLRHQDKVGSSGVQMPKKQNFALAQKIANLPKRVFVTKRTSLRRLSN